MLIVDNMYFEFRQILYMTKSNWSELSSLNVSIFVFNDLAT